MAGYNATSNSRLFLAIGIQSLQVQSALAYVPNQVVQITYTLNPETYLIGTVQSYNPVTGMMTVNVTSVIGSGNLQQPWNTQVWGSTSAAYTGWNIALIGGVPASTAAVVPTILVRNLGPTWDPARGSGLANYLADVDAVAQIIAQRLKFWEGEWFQNTQAGTPALQQLLGHPTTLQAVALVLREQILATPYVTSIVAFTISYNPTGRAYQFAAAVQTQFGTVTVSTN